jgi:(p)ppGpp synthase/HD superfamily hydrolase
MEEYLGQTQKNIEDIKHELESLMFRNGFDVKISGRVKNLFSIYKKLKKKTATLDDIYDVFALRIVLNSDGNSHTDKPENIEILYKILSVLHSRYENMPERFKNYISNPKPNGYQSLHTTLIGLNSKNFTKPTEVQIRTAAMDRFSEHGYAAHWLYKQSHSLPQDDKFLKIWSDLRKNAGTIDSGTAVLKMNLYPDRVFALTPDNLVRELPLGATPIDFAFNVHSEIGHHCHLAKVNGQVVPLDYKLKNGDVVEIFTSQKVNTKLNWLEFAFTKQARNRIKSYFRALDKGSLFEQGEEELNLLLVKLGLEKLDENLSLRTGPSCRRFMMRLKPCLVRVRNKRHSLPRCTSIWVVVGCAQSLWVRLTDFGVVSRWSRPVPQSVSRLARPSSGACSTSSVIQSMAEKRSNSRSEALSIARPRHLRNSRPRPKSSRPVSSLSTSSVPL